MLAYLPSLFQGLLITIELALFALLLGLSLGMLSALGESSRHKAIRFTTHWLVTIIRGLPELLILLFIYYGTTLLLTSLFSRYVEVSPFLAGVIALGLIFGAYASQVLRGALQAIPRGQGEAALALGMKPRLIFFRIQLPQMWRLAIPGLGNLWLVLLKDTALVSIIGLADLMGRTQLAASNTQLYFNFFFLVAVFYLVLTFFSEWVIRLFIRRQTHYLTRKS